MLGIVHLGGLGRAFVSLIRCGGVGGCHFIGFGVVCDRLGGLWCNFIGFGGGVSRLGRGSLGARLGFWGRFGFGGRFGRFVATTGGQKYGTCQ
ncbi:hypothetical protein [Moraxella lacunata]|uniref:hypothetical protein n=1 Tax=Moraxella lacunata TaxID=477 RepID=UPI003EE00B90